jgi:hypothetical protein
MLPILFVSLLVSMLFTVTQAANSTPDGRRGLARMMQFEELSEYNNGGLDKRGLGRGTWYVVYRKHSNVIMTHIYITVRYTGYDLKHAACFNRNGLPRVDARVDDMIGAMAMYDFEQCNKCMEITNNRQKSKKIIVQIIDKCAACKVGKAIDLTPGAFKKLAANGDLNIGVLDISFKHVKCPSHGIFGKLGKLL